MHTSTPRRIALAANRRALAAGLASLGLLFTACADEDGDGATTDEEIGELVDETTDLVEEVEEEVEEGVEEVDENDG